METIPTIYAFATAATVLYIVYKVLKETDNEVLFKKFLKFIAVAIPLVVCAGGFYSIEVSNYTTLEESIVFLGSIVSSMMLSYIIYRSYCYVGWFEEGMDGNA